MLARVPKDFLLRSDNGLVFTSRLYTRLARSHGLRQAFITGIARSRTGWGTPSNARTGLAPRLASMCPRIIGNRIRFYNTQRPRQTPGMRDPAEPRVLAARLYRNRRALHWPRHSDRAGCDQLIRALSGWA